MAAPRLQTGAKSHRTHAVTDTQILRRLDAHFVRRTQFAISAQQGCHFTPAAFPPWGKVSHAPWHWRLLAQFESRLRRRLARDTPSVGISQCKLVKVTMKIWRHYRRWTGLAPTLQSSLFLVPVINDIGANECTFYWRLKSKHNRVCFQDFVNEMQTGRCIRALR